MSVDSDVTASFRLNMETSSSVSPETSTRVCKSFAGESTLILDLGTTHFRASGAHLESFTPLTLWSFGFNESHGCHLKGKVAKIAEGSLCEIDEEITAKSEPLRETKGCINR